MSRVEIPVEAKLSTGDIDAELKQLTAKINALGASIAQANRVKFNPISRASLDDVKRMNAEFEKLKRNSQLGVDLNRTGQGNKSFLDIDWSSISSNSVAREARRYVAFNKVLSGTGASFEHGAGSGSGGGGGGGRGGRPAPGGGGSPWASAGRGIVSSGLRATGAVGGVADEAIGAGISGGTMAGVAGLLGGVAALAVGKAIGAVVNKIGDAQQDDIGYDTLKRTLGDVNVSFNVLKDSMHKASDAIDVTYSQAQKMAGDFARISGVSGKAGSETLAQEVAIGGGFGRAFGVDPEQSNSFFASMRLFGVTGSSRDSSRLGVEIAEGITKSGAFSKTDEVLQAIGAYTSQQTRMGLAPANVGGYNAMLTSMVGAGVPGMDVTGSAAVLSRVNSAIANGGNAGEAGQNFMYAAIGRKLNLDPIMGAALREQGMFGTGQQEFVSGSVMGDWASRHGTSIGSAASSTATNWEMLQTQLKSMYSDASGRGGLRLDAMHNLYGLSYNQAAFMDDMKPNQMGQVSDRLKLANIDPKDLNPTAFAMAAQAAIGDREQVRSVGENLWSKLSPAEQDSLNKAQASGDSDYRNELMKLAAAHGQGDTEGSKTRETIQSVDKTLIDFAGKAVPALNVMRDTMLSAFGRNSAGNVMTPAALHQQVIDSRKKDVTDKYDALEADARRKYGYKGRQFGEGVDYDAMRASDKALNPVLDQLIKQRAAELKKIDDDDAKDNPAASTPGSTAALPDYLQQTAGAASPGSRGNKFDPITGGAARSGDSRGVRNHNPGNLWYGNAKAAIAAGGTGVDPDGFGVFASNMAGTAAMDKQLAMYGSQHGIHTITDAIHRWAKPGKDNPNDPNYIAFVSKQSGYGPDQNIDLSDPMVRRKITQAMAGFEGASGAYQLSGTPLPSTGGASSGVDAYGNGGAIQYVQHDHVVTIQYPNGQPAAAPLSITGNVSAPKPLGN